MLEQQRQQYLSVLGLDSYTPRRILPGAAAPIVLSDDVLVFEDEDSISSSIAASPLQELMTTAHTLPDASIPASPLTDKVGRVEGNGDSDEAVVDTSPRVVLDNDAAVAAVAAPVESSNTESSPASATGTQEAVNFVLNVWRIGHDCLVVDSRQPGSALPTDKLLHNIVRAMGYPLAQLPPSELLRWPLFKSAALKYDYQADVDQARAMVQAYISAQALKSPLQYVVLMGEEATTYGLEQANFAELNGSVFNHSSWSAMTAVTPSLISMLQAPLQKTIAWQALQHFISQ